MPESASGEFTQTQQVLANALRHTAEWVGDHDIYAAMVDTAARSKNREILQQITPLAEESAGRYEHQLYMGIANRARGILYHLNGDLPDALTRLEEANTLFETTGARWQLGRTLLCTAEVLREMGEVAASIEKAEKAAALFDVVHAVEEHKQAKRLLAELGSAGQ